MDEISRFLYDTRRTRVLVALVITAVFFVGGLIYVGDFSLPAILNRLVTAIVQTAMCSFLITAGCIIYVTEKEDRINGDDQFRQKDVLYR